MKLRVAICFRGLIREGIFNRPTFAKFFENKGWDVDFFCHTWDYENIATPFLEAPIANTPLWTELKAKPISTLSSYKVDKFQKVYNLRGYKVDNFKKYRKISNRNTTLPNDEFVLNYHPQFTSAFESNNLKLEYEQKHNFKYDVVINTRADIVFDPNSENSLISNILKVAISKHPYIGIVNLHSNWSVDDSFFDDVCYIAKSENMNTLCEYFNPKTNTEQHNYLGRHIQNSGLEVLGVPCGYTILRNYLNFLHPIDDYNEIFIGNLIVYFDRNSIGPVIEGAPHLQKLYEQTLSRFI